MGVGHARSLDLVSSPLHPRLQCVFEETDPDGDEVVLMKLLELSALCVRSEVGSLLRDRWLWAVFEKCLYVSREEQRRSSLLRSTADNILAHIVLVIFSRESRGRAAKASGRRLTRNGGRGSRSSGRPSMDADYSDSLNADDDDDDASLNTVDDEHDEDEDEDEGEDDGKGGKDVAGEGGERALQPDRPFNGDHGDVRIQSERSAHPENTCGGGGVGEGKRGQVRVVVSDDDDDDDDLSNDWGNEDDDDGHEANHEGPFSSNLSSFSSSNSIHEVTCRGGDAG